MAINKEKAAFLIKIAKRTIRIVELLEKDWKDFEIVNELGCNRQIVNYYRQRLSRDD